MYIWESALHSESLTSTLQFFSAHCESPLYIGIIVRTLECSLAHCEADVYFTRWHYAESGAPLML